jgi:hypothetical protein
MPTIEIVSLGASFLGVNESDFSVAVIEERELISHRGMFYHFLKKHNGTIIHIGNPEFRTDKNSGFYAGNLIDWNFKPGYIVFGDDGETLSVDFDGNEDDGNFRFIEQYKADIDSLLNIAIENSPERKVFFLTDYQFGPQQEKIETGFTIRRLWDLHDNQGIRFNTLYEIRE